MKIIRKLYNLYKGFFWQKKRKMEDPIKVQAKVKELNRKSSSGALVEANLWIAVPGYFALTGFKKEGVNNIFDPNFGYIVKIFVNIQTGEIKVYSFIGFESE